MVATQAIQAIISSHKTETRRKPLLPHKLIDRLNSPSDLRIPATFEDWIELSVNCHY